MATKSKRVEVISTKIKCFGNDVTFEQILSIVNGGKLQNELLLGTLVGYLLFRYKLVDYCNSKEFIKQFTSIGTCAFGFLLTLFGLMVQSNGDVIAEIRKRKISYRSLDALKERGLYY